MTTSRDDIRQLVDALADDDVVQAGLFLRWLVSGRENPVLSGLAGAPVDDDELSEDERMAVAGAGSARFYSHEEAQTTAHEAAKRRLGIS